MTRRILALLLAAAALTYAADALPWNLNELYAAPKTVDAPHNGEPGVKTILFEGLPFKGKPTRVFAYYGAPEHTGNAKKFPAMVLIHGGGGTAFAEWVRVWNRRGYAAIAMDTVGTRPKLAAAEGKTWNPDRTRDEFSGPAGWGDFANVDLDPKDQWSYHAVAAAIRAHSLLRTFAEVDPKRIGVTGISWGGYLTSIVAGLDTRFQFAAPVYGCGFLGEDSAWLKNFAQLGPKRARRWLSLWDPSVYLSRAKLPMLWVNGTNDSAYPPGSWQKSHRLTRGKKTLAVRVRMPHGHPQGALPEEIHAYANSILMRGARAPKITRSATREGKFEVRFAGGPAVTKVELNYTRDAGRWQDRKWESTPAELAGGKRASAAVPAGATAYYLNLFDAEGRVVSSEYVIQ
ncbi:MAG: dipeptidyl aminopeptidase [Acidobacteria bacterium]|nr:dipeptidyl aminopeptidase [Acidobacteriota bacterium]